jgi:predicted Zn-dependent protease
LGDVYYQSGRFSDAVTAYRRGTELNATHTGLHLSLAIALLGSGDPDAALETMKQETDDAMRQYGLALAFDAAGQRGDADRALAALETNFAGTNAEQIASLYACRGQVNRAFAWLDRSLLQREGWPTSIKLDPCIKHLLPDPRLKVLLGKLNLPL